MHRVHHFRTSLLAYNACFDDPHVREGDILVVPVVEEVLVMEKRLLITEELRIRIVHSHERVEQTVPLRRQRAMVEHLQPASDDVPV